MPVKLISHLRLLNPSLPVASLPPIKSSSPFTSSRSISVFSRIFPFKLKTLGVLPSSDSQVAFYRFSTRRQLRDGSRPGSESNRAGRDRGTVCSSKSLIEDEAELSDWVSELRTSSGFRGTLTSDDESESSRGSRGRNRDKDRGSGERFSIKERSRENFDSFPKRVRIEFRRDNGVREEGGERFDARRRTRGNANVGDGGRGGRERELNSRGDGKGMRGKSGFRSDYDNEQDGERFGSRRSHGNVSMRNGKRGGIERESGLKREGKELRGKFGGFDDEEESGITDGDVDVEEERFSPLKSRANVNVVNGKRGGRERGLRFSRNGRGLRGNRGSADDDEEDESVADDDEEDESVADDDERAELMKGLGDFLIEEETDDGLGDEFQKKAIYALGLEKESNVKEKKSSPEKSNSYLSETRFDQCAISLPSLKGIKDAGYENMTLVQEATLPVILRGKDVLAKAKTGTGKTIAFLLPSIEVVLKSPPVDRDNKRPPILVLVICPTRELATQAAAEANTLLKYHPTIGVQVVIGGTRLTLEQKRMQANPCQILVATPGRLRDHVENTAGFATRLKGVEVLVLDEADHLLDMGFRKEIERIIASVPKQRQTLLFSATVPEEVRQICYIALKRDHEFINTVQEGDEETHAQVKQMHLVAPLDKQFTFLYALLKDHIADDVNYKVLVFCTTAMVTRLVANLLGELNLNVREIHSRKPQSYRTRVSDEFRKSRGLILVTSDVSARGVDYPDVSIVVQVGLPADREQYIHRLGRTGRKGREGQGILLLAPWEEFFLSTIKDLPIAKAPLPSVDPDTKKKVERALSHVDMKNKEAAYQAWLGYYNSNKTVGRDKYKLVELANEFSRSMGLDNPPAIPKLVLGKMGLKNVPGLRSK